RLPGSGSACAPASLFCARLTDFFDEQRVDPTMRIETWNSGETTVDHETHAINRDRGFGDIRCHHNLALIVSCDGCVLIARRQFSMEREKQVALRFRLVTNGVNRTVDLIATRHEDQHIAVRTTRML